MLKILHPTGIWKEMLIIRDVMSMLYWKAIGYKKGLKIPKRQSEYGYRRRTSNTMATRKSTSEQYVSIDWLQFKVRVMVFNTTLNISSVTSWRSVLLVKTRRKPQTCPSHCQTLSHVVSSTPRHDLDLSSQL